MAYEKILVVEDNEEVLSILEKKLANEKYRISTAITGGEALEKAKKEPPDLVLLDLMLPDLDGSEVAKSLQEDPLTENVPVIFLSGIVGREEGQSTAEVKVGGKAYPAIGKPFTFEEILNEIRKNIS